MVESTVFLNQLETYFAAEKVAGLIFILFGLLAFFYAYFFFQKGSFLKGTVISIVLVGMIQITVGSVVYFRTDRQVEHLKNQLVDEPQKFYAEEGTRMLGVNASFSTYFYIELSLAIIATFLLAFGRARTMKMLAGFAAGLLIRSLLMLLLDLFARARAETYLQQIFDYFAA